ncbi:MAG: hypothetical protein L0322_22760 [Chloroflexi bacterium]|nr:hypothetical protein [Chloroflexota bacterium]
MSGTRVITLFFHKSYWTIQRVERDDEILEMLEMLGQARVGEDGRYMAA